MTIGRGVAAEVRWGEGGLPEPRPLSRALDDKVAKPAEACTWTPPAPPMLRPLRDAVRVQSEAEARDHALGDVFRQAYAEGIKAGELAVTTIMNRYHKAIAEIEALRDHMIREAQEDLVHLALVVAREALGSDCADREAFTAVMVEHALRLLREADRVTLRVSKTDATWIREKRPELLAGHGIVRIVEDPALNVGGVIAESELGRVDATLERRLAEIGRQLASQTHAQAGQGQALAGDPAGKEER